MSVETEYSAPAVSVCIPMYNNADTIARCLESIAGQDFRDFELLIIDDDSTDGSYEIASSLAGENARVLRNEVRLGLVGNHNRCLSLARGRAIQFVHGDDLLLPGCLSTLSPLFDDGRVGLAFAPRIIETEDVTWRERHARLEQNFRDLGSTNEGAALVAQFVRGGARGNWVGEPTCVMVRRSTALDVGGLDEGIYQLVDMDLWMRIMQRSTVAWSPVELSVRFHHGASESFANAAQNKDWLDRYRILSKVVADSSLPLSLRASGFGWGCLVWADLFLASVVRGPDRARRAKLLLGSPRRELRRAREQGARRLVGATVTV
ncbi:glycosyltransferase family 2 protein [Rhodococcus sp. UNC363MFTsu5.1]|uniref:glycosyltransferase family 2 protein n=1 Tax=Rhodococcus sp. UNC363MFTsu5.1 TaxID=1449069 RepID=UPI00068C8221|nr:glycosyltransferase [Rhodococcus sp. UNC363MFTsu5.1]